MNEERRKALVHQLQAVDVARMELEVLLEEEGHEGGEGQAAMARAVSHLHSAYNDLRKATE